MELQEDFKNCKINTRVKTQNSIGFKTKKHFENYEISTHFVETETEDWKSLEKFLNRIFK